MWISEGRTIDTEHFFTGCLFFNKNLHLWAIIKHLFYTLIKPEVAPLFFKKNESCFTPKITVHGAGYYSDKKASSYRGNGKNPDHAL